jgi:hypothetical protein
MARKKTGGLSNFGTHRAKPFKKGGGRRELTKGEKASGRSAGAKTHARQRKST